MQLVLDAFGLETDGLQDQFGPSVQDVLIRSSEDQLTLIAQHLGVPVPGVLPAASTVLHEAPSSRSREPLYLFASHLVTHSALLGAVAARLQFYGITLFVAHSSISPSEAWHDEIVKALRNAHAGVAFLHDGFIQSTWCDQEVGWLLGRDVPVFALMFTQPPYGPLSKWQALDARRLDADGLAEAIVDLAITKPALHPNLATSLAGALSRSTSFRWTDRIWGRLRNLAALNDEQCVQIMTALEENNQVANRSGAIPWSVLEERPYSQAIPAFLRQQPGIRAIAARLDAWQA